MECRRPRECVGRREREGKILVKEGSDRGDEQAE